MNLVLTTVSVPEGERLAYWRDALTTALVPMTVTARGDGPFSGRISAARLGHLRVCAMEADPHRTSRTHRHIAQAPADYLAIGVQTAGTATLVQDGRHTEVGEGDLVVYDTTRPYCLDYPERFSTRIVQMPRRTVGLPEEDLRRVTGTAIPATEGFDALLASFLTTLTASVPACSPSVAATLAAGVVDLFATLVDERTRQGRQQTARAPHDHLLPRIRDHIDRNLGDPELSPHTVAAAHHISVRYLHRLFEGEGITVTRLIQQRRLQECARELGLPGASRRTVSAVAQRWGFANPAHFSRVFRGAYGVSPREWRGTGGRGGAVLAC
ncbi:helix-turn-helix domain-containing protein [Streptomyces sp. NPDC013178]|uniref:AraC-like ligand-binding domain-containing protein n=1 Tax=unclassified Streptomyces TaxID=2593676 RepID=UPI0033E40B9A